MALDTVTFPVVHWLRCVERGQTFRSLTSRTRILKQKRDVKSQKLGCFDVSLDGQLICGCEPWAEEGMALLERAAGQGHAYAMDVMDG